AIGGNANLILNENLDPMMNLLPTVSDLAGGNTFGTNLKLSLANVVELEVAQGTTTINSLLQDAAVAGALVTPVGAGGTLVLTHANAYTGGTFLGGGTVNIQKGSALGSGNVDTVFIGATLQVQGGITVDNAITIAGGTLENVQGNNTLTGAITLTANSIIQ